MSCSACSTFYCFEVTPKSVVISSNKNKKVTSPWSPFQTIVRNNGERTERSEEYKSECFECSHPLIFTAVEVGGGRRQTEYCRCWACEEVILRGYGTVDLLKKYDLEDLLGDSYEPKLYFAGAVAPSRREPILSIDFSAFHQECADLVFPSWREELAKKKAIKNKISSSKKRIDNLEIGRVLSSILVSGILFSFLVFISKDMLFGSWVKILVLILLIITLILPTIVICAAMVIDKVCQNLFNPQINKLKADLEYLQESLEKPLPMK